MKILRSILKFILRLLVILLLIAGLALGSWFGYAYYQMKKNNISYTDVVENTILSFVPEEGITIRGRNYEYWSVLSFLEEIRYSSDYYIHKDHHCILAELPDSQIHEIVDAVRFVMGCK